MKKILLILIVTILVTSCHFSNKYQNREADKMDAQKEIADLFYVIRHSEFDKATEFFGDEFYEVTLKEDLMKIFESTERKLGYLDRAELTDWNTMVSEGAIESGIYNMNYNVKFEKGDAKLKLTLTKNEKGKIKVVGYNVQSKAFMN
ncbi:MAG: hypothetical protein ABJK28_16305 [Algibacter sp.]